MPRTNAVKDYISGSASLFTNELARDKDFLGRVLEGISCMRTARSRSGSFGRACSRRWFVATRETFGPASFDIDDSVDHAGIQTKIAFASPGGVSVCG